MVTLRKRLVMSYIMVAMICVFLIGIFSNVFLEKQFKSYVLSAHENKVKGVVASITDQFSKDGDVNLAFIEAVGVEALENGLIISISNSNDEIIWDASVYDSGRCEAILTNMAKNMMDRYSNWKGKYVEIKYPMVNANNIIGSVKVGYYGPFYYSDNDLAFLKKLNALFIGVGTVSLLMAIMVGLIMASALTRPIYKVIKASKGIRRGEYKNRINEVSNVVEIKNLIDTINDLAKTLENQEYLRKRLTQDVAHELRTPLTTLQSHMEAMIDGVWEPTIERIKSCHEESIRINKLVGDLEKLSRYESDKFLLNKSEFNIGELIGNIIMNFENEYMNKNVDLKYKSLSKCITGDKDKISQVVVNLLSNALKYTKEGGNVDVILEEESKNIVLTVRDTGIGISKEDLPHIFERFYRADKSRTRITGGAGIGLAIVRSVIEAHNGKVIVESNINEGTVFKVFLPI